MSILDSIQQANKPGGVNRQRARRAATEDAIIDAFERVLEREGAAGLGVNAVIKEAGIGKRQLYAYFGGLPGVASEWIVRRNAWPSLDTLRGESKERFALRPPAQKVRIVNRNYAEALRRSPPLCELLTGEFNRSVELKAAIEHVRQRVRVDFEQLFSEDPELARPEIMELSAIAYAASTYLAMRANAQPMFFGFDLSQPPSWSLVMGMFDRVFDNVQSGSRTREAA